jgi:hypothetical protein
VRSSSSIWLIVGLMIVTAIAVFALVRAAPPGHGAEGKCVVATQPAEGCDGNSLLYIVAIGIVIAAWRCRMDLAPTEIIRCP